jgi:integrase
MKPMVVLSLNTGMRQGEVFNLKWQDCDFQQGDITVSGATAKSGRTRHVPMNSTVRETLSAWREQVNPADPSAFVFPGANRTRLDNVKTSWANLLKEAGITVFRWHDMRHTFASRLVMGGVDLYIVSRLLGHSSFQMTQRYAHLAPRQMQDAVEKLVRESNVISLSEAASARGRRG